MNKVNLTNKLSLFSEPWRPKIVGELNDSYIKLAKLKGAFVWHSHEAEDEMFFVVKGRLIIRFRDQCHQLKGPVCPNRPNERSKTSSLSGEQLHKQTPRFLVISRIDK